MSQPESVPYPRLDFGRTKLHWQSLDGIWKLAFDDGDVGIREGWQRHGLPTQHCRQIKVPFAYQTAASGIHERKAHEILWYERTISDIRNAEQKSLGQRLLLRFGAVDYGASVWVDGEFVGSHRGGHVPFDIDVTDALTARTESGGGIHSLTVRVFDSTSDLTQPRGKQYWKAESESIWYTPTSGIWQSVWLESVPSVRIGDGSYGTIIRSNDIKTGTLRARVAVVGKKSGHAYTVQLEVSYRDFTTAKTERAAVPVDRFHVEQEANVRLTSEQLKDVAGEKSTEASEGQPQWHNGIALWSPEYPALYDLVIRLYSESGDLLDEVKTTTGMRSLEWENGDRTWLLNGRPYLQMLVLDQGYWADTGMTPPTMEALRKDIELSKALGFNGCRKHQKVEDPLFLYWADRLGYLVWGEMANAYEFDETYVDRFNDEWLAMVKRDINHPCVVAWTPGNESWGYTDLENNIQQRNHLRSLYYLTKTLDPTRPVNDNCGWEHVSTDLTTFHEYADAEDLMRICSTREGILEPKAGRAVFVSPISGDKGASMDDGAPVLCTEFGGVNIARATTGDTNEWGYTTASDSKDLLLRIERLVSAVMDSGWCCGFVYTQLTDIEQEVNGLYTIDRTAKLEPAAMVKILEQARTTYDQRAQHR